MTKNKSKKSFLKTYAPILLFVFFSSQFTPHFYFHSFSSILTLYFTISGLKVQAFPTLERGDRVDCPLSDQGLASAPILEE